ncbi:phage terminase large subunit family protein [Clostridium tyrobutyricum]|uniref:phage terminase large subunit family protein n=1 Tax=Clostridium tyrobutyricum TaxID=1519 RepID=UPI0020CB0862|nr:phage terminase large subunit family protein [Clostridium tyrobutyricum]
MSKRKKIQVKKKTIHLFKNIIKILCPPPELTVSQWADTYRYLSQEASAEHGRWRTDRTPYLKDIMDSVNDNEVEVIVIMSSAQIGKSELLLNTIGYFVDYDPSPILMMQPTETNAKDFSKDRIATMIRDSPVLRNKVSDDREKDSSNTILHKTFPGGHLSLVGANAPAGLASRPIRILLADEVDRYPLTVGVEGDPLSLAEKRTKTFWNKKKIFVSTPTEEGISRIAKEFNSSTQEEWCLPCPVCGKFQPLEFERIKFEDVTMECKYCKERFNEFEWKSGQGKWIAKNPDVHRKRGFHLNALVSPWERWENIIIDFREAKKNGTETLKTWVNTTLGKVWKDKSGEGVDKKELLKRRKTYDCDVPEGSIVLTAGVDVQDDRLEIEVVGWGIGKQSWGIEYTVFHGDPGQDVVWNQLDNYLQKNFYYNDGSALVISCVCIDSGGHYTTEVYRFCKPREHRRIFAIKGYGGTGKPFIGKVSRNNRERAALFPLGVDTGKETLLSRLKIEFEGPGYCNFPKESSKGYDENYFDGITSERRIIKYSNGIPKFQWIKKGSVRNEPLDIRNYATAALEILNPDLESMAEQNKNGNIFIQQSITTKRKRRRVVSRGL